MKFMHLSDLHLGRTLGDFDLTEDQEFMMDLLIKTAEEQAVDALLLSGDIYDKKIPSEAAVRILDRFLGNLAGRDIPVFMISGNHDSDERLGFGSGLFRSNRIFISTKYEGKLCRQSLKVRGEEADIYLLPFVRASHVRHFHPESRIESYDDAVRAVIENADIDRDRCNILVAHQFVAGKDRDPFTAGSESLGTLSVGTVEKIGYDCFKDFDYTALGHIHSPQSVGRKEIRYSGSPLKYSLSEVNNEKSVPIVTIRGKGDVDIRLIPLKPKRDLRHLRGSMKELLSESNVRDRDDFIYATLTDEDIVSDAMGIFQQTYPNTVKIDYDNSHTREIEQVDITKIAENRSYEDLISDFYREIYGVEISEEEMDIMRSVAREAGVLYEAG